MPALEVAGADADEHEAELADRRVGQHLLHVVLGEADDRREQRRQRADGRHDRHRARRQQVDGVHARDHVDAGGHHGGGVNQRRDRRRAGHRVGQPDVERNLRRLAGGADEEEQRRPEGDRRGKDGPGEQRGHETAAAAGRARRDLLEVERPRVLEQQEHPDQEPEVADPVDDERLLAGVRVGGLLVPKTDQQVAAEADALPADEHHREAVPEDQHQHRAAEEVQVGEEARVVGVMLHVPRRVDVNQEPDEGDDQAEQPREAVHPERQIDLERAGGDPGADRVVQAAARSRQRQRGEEGVERHQAGAGDGARGDRDDRVARPLAAEQHQDRGAEERQQRNEAKVEGHGRVSLSASSR